MIFIGQKVRTFEREPKISTKTPIVSWSAAPDATFVCGDENRHYAVRKKNDGLYLYTGTFIIVR